MNLTLSSSDAGEIGKESGVMRRDPSDIIKVGDLYYVWYSRGPQSDGYNATLWYATSQDGHQWSEKREALARGAPGEWDDASVFTPNIMVAKGKYWLFYTGIKAPVIHAYPNFSKTAIGLAVSDSPDGPWLRVSPRPVLVTSNDPTQFDSLRVDDAGLIMREKKYWLYYKGRKEHESWQTTKMGVAIAENPEGPYVRYAGNPVVGGGHEVLVWPLGAGVASATGIGPEGLRRTIQYAPDGLHFSTMLENQPIPDAAGAYRPEAFTDSGKGKMIEWGIQIHTGEDFLPYLERFDYHYGIESQKK